MDVIDRKTMDRAFFSIYTNKYNLVVGFKGRKKEKEGGLTNNICIYFVFISAISTFNV